MLKIIILSNIDSKSLLTVLKLILEQKDKTIIIIAHNLSDKYVKLFDQNVSL